MSEIRFKSDELLENKIMILMKKMKIKTKRDMIVYLINKQFENVKEVK